MAPSKVARDSENTPPKTIVLLMGPTGSGKSTFMEVATRRTGSGAVGHSLKPYTTNIRAITFPHPSTGHPVVLVDTPGLDDTTLDVGVLTMITAWLQKSYSVSTIAGIVYLHRISDNRSVGSPQKNMELFSTLCGDVKKNVVIATTMWKQVTRSDVGTRRENGWRTLLHSESRIVRFHDTFASAWEIIDNVVKTRTFPMVSQPTSVTSSPQPDELVDRVGELPKFRTSNRRRALLQVRRLLAMDRILGYKSKKTTFLATISQTSHPEVQSEVQRGLKRRRSLGAELSSKRQSIALDQTVAVPINVEDLSEEQTIIILMGLSGSGKSSFINAATGYDDGMIGHSLETYTQDVKLIKFRCPQRKNISFVFIDTPAFNYNTKTHLEVLQTDAKRLNPFFGANVTLAGILYLHSIPEYPTGEVRSDLVVFRDLCRKQFVDKQSTHSLKKVLTKDAYKNVIFVTTMWDLIDEEQGAYREKELKNKYWKDMISLGATTARFDGNPATAWDIIAPDLPTIQA